MRDRSAGGDASSLRICLVVSTYHHEVTDGLRQGAVDALRQAGAAPDAITVVPVPGAFEIPFAARRAAETGTFDGIVCLGCVIRGETPHFEYIASAVAHGIMAASQATRVPMSFGVLTTHTRDEALARAGEGDANKGAEAAMAIVQLATSLERLVEAGPTGERR